MQILQLAQVAWSSAAGKKQEPIRPVTMDLGDEEVQIA